MKQKLTMMYKTKFWATTICFVVLRTINSFAQENTDSLSMDVTFVGEREMVVKDAIKLQSWPEAMRLDGGNRDFSYKLLSKRMNITPEWTHVKPVRLKVDAPLARLYRGYVRAGFGNYNTPILDISLTDLRSREGTWGIKADHFSTKTPIDSITNRFSNSGVSFWTSRFIGKEKVDATVFIKSNNIVYYGNPNDDSLMPSQKGDITNNFLNYGTSLAFKSHHRDSTMFNHKLRFDWVQLRAGENLLENNYNVGIEFGKFVGSKKYSLNSSFNFDNLNIGETKINTALVSLEPTITSYRGYLTLTVGGGLGIDRDDESYNSDEIRDKLFVYPKVEASYSLMRNLFIPYFRYNAGIQQNRLQSVLNENPFYEYSQIETIDDVSLDTTRICPLNNTWRRNDMHLGMRGTITDEVSFNVFGRTVKYVDYMFFMNTSDTLQIDPDNYTLIGGNRFNVLYDDIRVSSLGGNISVEVSDNFSLGINGEFFRYSLSGDTLSNFWNLPKYNSSIDLRYTLLEKFTIGCTTTIVGARSSLSTIAPENVESSELITFNNGNYYNIELPGYVDLNLNFEYRYNERTSVWVTMNNITNNRYSHWAGYRVQGFQALFGASYAF